MARKVPKIKPKAKLTIDGNNLLVSKLQCDYKKLLTAYIHSFKPQRWNLLNCLQRWRKKNRDREGRQGRDGGGEGRESGVERKCAKCAETNAKCE